MIIIYFLISFLVIGCSPPLDLLSVNVIYDWNDIIKKYNITGIECSAPDDSANRQWLDYNKNILFNTLVYNYRKLNVYRTTDGYYRQGEYNFSKANIKNDKIYLKSQEYNSIYNRGERYRVLLVFYNAEQDILKKEMLTHNNVNIDLPAQDPGITIVSIHGNCENRIYGLYNNFIKDRFRR